jgi:hypothetical protein
MPEPYLNPEQVETIEKFEFSLSLLKDQDLLYSTFRTLIKELPNDYELGATIRKLFNS